MCLNVRISTNPDVVWHRVQLVSPPCCGPWQRTHAVPEPANRSLANALPGWHASHASEAWAPLSTNTLACLNVDGMNAVVL